jgi:DNA-directed RNA polymerase specialized sigma24 family protein
MRSESPAPGELLQKFGPTVSKILQRQFPSLPVEVIDDLVVEAIARLCRRLHSSPEQAVPETALFPLIFTAARRRAIDQLRYSPHLVFASPEFLEQSVPHRGPDDPALSGQLIVALKDAVARLEPLERRIIQAAMSPPASGDWARELALELSVEQSQSDKQPAAAISPKELSRLSGKLRVRKLRTIEKLRRAMTAAGYEIPEPRGVR